MCVVVVGTTFGKPGIVQELDKFCSAGGRLSACKLIVYNVHQNHTGENSPCGTVGGASEEQSAGFGAFSGGSLYLKKTAVYLRAWYKGGNLPERSARPATRTLCAE